MSAKDADQLRELLADLGLSQRGAAHALGISERIMRYYAAGDHPVPKVVWLALKSLSRPSPGKR